MRCRVGFGKPGFFHQRLQRQQLVFLGNHFQQGKQTHRGRVAFQFFRLKFWG